MGKELKENNQADFAKVYQMITKVKSRVWQQINKTLIQLYWSIGQYIFDKVTHDGWGKGTVEELANYISIELPTIKGFSARNIWRMKQFYETYNDKEELSTLLTEISWSNHLHVLSKTKSLEEKKFYLQLASRNRYSARDFSRLIDSSTYERTIIANEKLLTPLTEFPVKTNSVFKDSYVFEF